MYSLTSHMPNTAVSLDSLPQIGMNDKAIYCAALQINVQGFRSHYMRVHYSMSGCV